MYLKCLLFGKQSQGISLAGCPTGEKHWVGNGFLFLKVWPFLEISSGVRLSLE